MTIATTHAPLGAVSILRVVDILIGMKRTISQWNEKRQTQAELSRLTDSQLNDIGLKRFEIDLI